MADDTHPHGVPGYPLLVDLGKRRWTEIALTAGTPEAILAGISDRLRTATPHDLPDGWPPANWRNQIVPVTPTLEATLQWIDLLLNARPHLERAQLDGHEALQLSTGDKDVADAYCLYYAVTEGMGVSRTLSEPHGPHSLHGAIIELRRVRDALLVIKVQLGVTADPTERRLQAADDMAFAHRLAEVQTAITRWLSVVAEDVERELRAVARWNGEDSPEAAPAQQPARSATDRPNVFAIVHEIESAAADFDGLGHARTAAEIRRRLRATQRAPLDNNRCISATELHEYLVAFSDYLAAVLSDLKSIDALRTVESSNSSVSSRITPASPPSRNQLRRTKRGAGSIKLLAALTKHHKYADGGSLNLEPVGNNDLARAAGVDRSTASDFFKKHFKSHDGYKAICTEATSLVAALKLLNGEFSPHLLYGSSPPEKYAGDGDEDESDDLDND